MSKSQRYSSRQAVLKRSTANGSVSFQNPNRAFPVKGTRSNLNIQIPQVICIRDGPAVCSLSFRLQNLPPPFSERPQEQTPDEEQESSL